MVDIVYRPRELPQLVNSLTILQKNYLSNQRSLVIDFIRGFVVELNETLNKDRLYENNNILNLSRNYRGNIENALMYSVPLLPMNELRELETQLYLFGKELVDYIRSYGWYNHYNVSSLYISSPIDTNMGLMYVLITIDNST